MQNNQFNLSRRALVFSTAGIAVAPLSLVSGDAFAQAQLVDKSGSMRMLSQRIAKAYCQFGLGILPNDAETILAKSITRFQGALVSVKANPEGDKAAINRIEADWSQLRDLVSVAPQKASFAKVDALAESLLGQADAITAQVAALLRVNGGNVTNVSGRQRMLSQRMAKSAFAMIWGMDSRTYSQQFSTAREQFKVALAELKRNQIAAARGATLLETAESQFGILEISLGTRGELATALGPRAANIAKTNERILELFEELTASVAAA